MNNDAPQTNSQGSPRWEYRRVTPRLDDLTRLRKELEARVYEDEDGCVNSG